MSRDRAGFDLQAYLAGERTAVEASLARVVAENPEPGAEMAAVRYALGSGGKRLRPILCVAAWRAVRASAGATGMGAAGTGTAPGVYRIASAIELVHTYSLVHDDLPSMDDASLRRGRAATHRVFGVCTATLAGAVMIPLAVRVLRQGAAELGLPAPRAYRLAGELCRGAGASGMVGGQVMDLESEGRTLEMEALETLHRAKTGALLTASLRIGALAAGAEPDQVEALSRYGAGVGLAFQIADDLLDVTAAPAETGKTGGDVAREKATYPTLLGTTAARARGREMVEGAIAALAERGLETPALVALARYAMERER